MCVYLQNILPLSQLLSQLSDVRGETFSSYNQHRIILKLMSLKLFQEVLYIQSCHNFYFEQLSVIENNLFFSLSIITFAEMCIYAKRNMINRGVDFLASDGMCFKQDVF